LKPTQLKSEHPNGTYEGFQQQLLTETARPISMPYNIAAGDSSKSNFASAKLDCQTYFARIDIDRADCDDWILEKIFTIWWREAVLEYGWATDPLSPPPHSFSWPKHPVADVATDAKATDAQLKNGTTSPSAVYSAAGLDFDDEIIRLATDYGITPEEMRQRLLDINLPVAPAPAPPGDETADETAEEEGSPPADDEESADTQT
jgi:capsid protein